MISPKTATKFTSVSVAAAALTAFLLLQPPARTDGDTDLRYSSHTVTLAASGDGSAEQSKIVANPHPFRFVNSSWVKIELQRQPELRASPDGIDWSDWREIANHPHAGDNGFRSFGKILSFNEPMRFLQVRSAAGDLQAIDLTLVSPKTVAPQKVIAASSGDPVEKPPVVSRTEWGCPDGQGSRRTPSDSEVEFLIVHHTAGSNTSSNWAETVQAVWSFHTITRGWGDVGYNFLIDPNGVIYEGRSGGDDSIGAHFSCANSKTMGVSMLGDFTNIEPTQAALDSLKHLLAWKACKEGIDPQSTSFHSASQLDLNRISGHRDGNPSDAPGACPSGTVCPGAMLYPLLDGIRSDVATIIANGGVNIPQLELANRIFRDTSGGGNSDGQINPGEPIRLDVTINNTGTGAATGLTATLSSSDPAITITDGQKAFPDLAPGASADENGDFNFTVAPGTPDGHILSFDLLVSGAVGEWTFTLSAPVVAPPNLNIATAVASPAQLEPGEATTLSYSVDSDQSFTADFSLSLRSNDPTLFHDPSFDFSTSIAAGSQNKFRGLATPSDLPPGHYDLVVRVSESGESLAFFDQTFPNFLGVTAIDIDYDAWIALKGLPLEESAGDTDPDDDGLPNLIEFAFDLDPTIASILPVELHLIDLGLESFPAITFTARNSEHVSLKVERSNSGLGSQPWITAPNATVNVGSPQDHHNGTRTTTLRSQKNTIEEPDQFFRFRATSVSGN